MSFITENRNETQQNTSAKKKQKKNCSLYASCVFADE